MILFVISTSDDFGVSLGTPGNHFANLKVEVRTTILGTVGGL